MLPITQQFSEDHGPQVGVFEAAFELASMDTFVGGWARNSALDDMDSPTSKKLSPEELNSKYTDIGVPFTKPMSEVAAFHLNEEGKKRNELSRKISEGPNGTFYNQAVNIGGSLLAHALDPVEFGAGALTGLGLRGAGALINGSKAAANFSAIAKTGQALSKGTFAAEAVDGMLGNAILEPWMYAQQSRAQVDYGIEDSFISVVGGGMAMPILKKAFKSVIGLPDSTVGIAMKNSIGQAQEGFRPTPELHAKQYNDIAFKNPTEGVPMGSVRSEYKFEPMDITAPLDKPFYMTGASINESKTIGDFLGEGSYLTDNPHFANNIAAHPMDDSISDVFEVRLNETKLLDISKPIDPEVAKTIGLGDGAKEFLEANPEFQAQVIAKMKELGYDGFHQSDSVRGHNAIHLFPEAAAKIQEQARFKPDVKSVPAIDPKEVEAMSAQARSRENELDFDPELDKEFSEFVIPEEFKSMESARIEADMDDTLLRMGSLEKEGLLSAESKELLESVKKSKSERTGRIEVLKDFAACLLAGV